MLRGYVDLESQKEMVTQQSWSGQLQKFYYQFKQYFSVLVDHL